MAAVEPREKQPFRQSGVFAGTARAFPSDGKPFAALLALTSSVIRLSCEKNRLSTGSQKRHDQIEAAGLANAVVEVAVDGFTS